MILPAEVFLSHTLREHSWGEKVTRILAASLAAVEPGRLVRRSLQIQDDQLLVGNLTLDLGEYERIFLVGIGKASIPMTASAAEILTDRITQGIILSKTKQKVSSKWNKRNIKILKGGHPVPTQESLDGANKIKEMLSELTPQDLVLVLLSGGGSSLLSRPVPGISLNDLQITNQILLRCGGSIQEINTLRKHISSVKGGQLARIAAPAKLITLILSDVMGDPLDMIASGPTAPDPTTYPDTINIIEKYQLGGLLPASIIRHLRQGKDGEYPETPKPDDPLFKNVSNFIIGNNQVAVNAGLEQAKSEGFNIIDRAISLMGEASQAGSELANTLTRMASDEIPLLRPGCLIIGGETTVTMSSEGVSGKGGRNLETALSALIKLDGIQDAALITLASDGEDGLTGAAGSVVTGESYKRAKKLNLDPNLELTHHNSFIIFEKLDDLLKTGSTQTNVNDLCFLFTF